MARAIKQRGKYIRAEKFRKRVSEQKGGIPISKNLGENNGMWKGDKVGLLALHQWVRNRIPKPNKCEKCESLPFDLANKSNHYKRDLKDWSWLCRKCHMISDGRYERVCTNPFTKFQFFNIKNKKYAKNLPNVRKPNVG